MCNNKGTKLFTLVELECLAQNSISLKDEENLREAKRIVAIQAYRVGNVSVSPTGRAVVNDTVFKKSFLVLKSDNDEVIDKIPFTDMDRTTNNGQMLFVDIPPIQPSKCEIRLATTAGVVTTESYLLGFHYEK